MIVGIAGITAFYERLLEDPSGEGPLLDEAAEAVAIDLVKVLLDEAEAIPDQKRREWRSWSRFSPTPFSPINLVKVLLDKSPEAGAIDLVKVPLGLAKGHPAHGVVAPLELPPVVVGRVPPEQVASSQGVQLPPQQVSSAERVESASQKVAVAKAVQATSV